MTPLSPGALAPFLRWWFKALTKYNSDLTFKTFVLKPAARRWRHSCPPLIKRRQRHRRYIKPAAKTLFFLFLPQRNTQSWAAVKRVGPDILSCYRKADKSRRMLKKKLYILGSDKMASVLGTNWSQRSPW